MQLFKNRTKFFFSKRLFNSKIMFVNISTNADLSKFSLCKRFCERISLQTFDLVYLYIYSGRRLFWLSCLQLQNKHFDANKKSKSLRAPHERAFHFVQPLKRGLDTSAPATSAPTTSAPSAPFGKDTSAPSEKTLRSLLCRPYHFGPLVKCSSNYQNYK